MKLLISITLKEDVLDPQGLAIKNSLSSIGFDNINTVKQGKIINIDIKEKISYTQIIFLYLMYISTANR